MPFPMKFAVVSALILFRSLYGLFNREADVEHGALHHIPFGSSGDGLSLNYNHKLLDIPVLPMTLVDETHHFLGSSPTNCLSRDNKIFYEESARCLLNRLFITMQTFIVHQIAYLSTVFQANPFATYLCIPFPFLIIKYLRVFTSDGSFIASFLWNTYQFPLVGVLSAVLDIYSENGTPYPLHFESNIHYGGGNISRIVSPVLLETRLVSHPKCGPLNPLANYRFVKYLVNDNLANHNVNNVSSVLCRFTLSEASNWLNVHDTIVAGKRHGINLSTKMRRPQIAEALIDHTCDICLRHVCVFEEMQENESGKTKNETPSPAPPCFPPCPPSNKLVEKIINGFCADSDPTVLQEAGCAVCGRLCRMSDLSPLDNYKQFLDILAVEGVTRQERKNSADPINDINGPVLDNNCSNICPSCAKSVEHNTVPLNALANGLWIGDVPPQLQNLSFAERMMIARIRHNRCLVRVSSGRAKMTANVIMYSNPTLKVYHILPPSKDEMNEVLAFVFTGSSQPTDEDFKRCPMLVRRQKVQDALEWLKLNHRDYGDLEISQENLASYPLIGIPVKVDFKKIEEDSNRIPATMSLHDNEDEEGSSEGPCPFTVHGLSGADYGKMSIQALKARALRHLESEGKMLGIGHDSAPQSMYDNPQAYPQMFPWLFPYGLGGIGQASLKKRLSELEHKHHLLMYNDKRFQYDLYFPIIAFNHEQLKGGITGSFLLTKRQNFADISRRLLLIDKTVLADVTSRLANGEHVKPTTEQEKACFSVLDDLDHIGGYVKGSLTSKKYMRNEIWSLLAFFGAPSWFITLSPADNRHPISLYFASQNITFQPDILSSSERNRLVANNPIAAARFFHLIVELFIKHVLGIDNNNSPGLYGETSAYYGTVEQQGRLTLHLHLLLWIKGALSPQEIRDRLMNKDSIFQKELITYLESVHKGEFITGTMQDVKERVPHAQECDAGIHTILKEEKLSAKLQTLYKDPTLTMPDPVPLSCGSCKENEEFCDLCITNREWWDNFNLTVDDIILRSNVHRCSTSADTKTAQSHNLVSASKKIPPKGPKGCLDKNGNCKARFPRDTYEETVVDNDDGHIFMKKLESMLNTFSPVLSYLTRSNTDVTSLLSGTSIKAIVSYITDYISKPALKTYQIFSSMYDIFEKNDSDAQADIKGDNTRRLLLKIVNSLSSKLEIGSPMASMYLLGNPDHYTSHKFVPFWWRSYVNDVKLYWNSVADAKAKRNKAEDAMDIDEPINDVENLDTVNGATLEDKVVLGRHQGKYVGSSNVDDYKYRPRMYNNMSLFEWIQTAVRRKRTKKEMESLDHHAPMLDDYESEVDAMEDVYNVHKSKYAPFLNGHPLSNTHVVKCDFENTQTIVPNFVGGPLPRCDQDDRENYCCTMLTLFKPWRTGSDLKMYGQTWDAAYEIYNFSDRHKDLMKNFNLRYECLDARDDFQAELQKKQAETRKKGPHFEHNFDEVNEADDDFIHRILSDENDDFDIPGPAYERESENKCEADAIMRSSGWLDKPSHIKKHSHEWFSPTVGHTHTEWASVIKVERDRIFKEKMSGYIQSIGDTDSKLSALPDDDVRILSADYLLESYKAKSAEHRNIVEETIHKFSLNEEQERAFRIIANHASSLAPPPLNMNLGGMGGTGKSQVIKAVSHMFNERNESHRFLVLAPTGSAAALLNGSTYHRALGIRPRSEKGVDYLRNEGAIINEVRSRLQGVEYIFIDEISMISCRELFAISQRLSQVFNKDTLFGGVNMILAGDFAQLPPVGNQSLYSPHVSNKQDHAMKPQQQEATLGKIFWHQFTTVVILKQNMRQTTQSEEDAKLRTALENMRYAACTPDDIAFLNTLVAKNLQKHGKPCLTDPKFRNVSVITAWNNQKDRFNEQGSARFAADNEQQLTHFYSIDTLGPQDENGPKKIRRKLQRQKPCKMSPKLQEALWNRSPCSSEHVASKLSLCVGMPMMIRNNDATELCITKGQEAVVVGWDSSVGPFGKPVLDTLFVKLIKPPREVKLPGLPTNVVPLTRASTRVLCTLKSGAKIVVQRQQILALPNFAMTDYASQGKTREQNVVHPSRCKDHMSYYTCLSRSSSAKGTILLAEPDPNKITKGISGYLRQEFRELHILDEVTKLMYKGRLPDGILHSLRNPTIRAYMLWNKMGFGEKNWHPALAYKKNENRLKEPENDGTWILGESLENKGDKKKRTKVPDNDVKPPANKSRRFECDAEIRSTVPKGLIWDSVDYSCAYDSLFTVLYNIWEQNTRLWQRRFGDISANFELLGRGFQQALDNESTLEMARNHVRSSMTLANPAYFPVGMVLTSISRIVESIIPARSCGISTLECETCGYRQANPLLHFGEHVLLTSTGCFHDNSEDVSLLSDVLGWQLNNRQRRSERNCPECIRQQHLSKLKVSIHFERIPYLMIIEFSTPRYIIDWGLNYNADGLLIEFKLAGIIYSGQDHFVSRVIDNSGMVWYHDGITTGRRCSREGWLRDVAERTAQLRLTEEDDDGWRKSALYAIYIRD